MAFIKSIPDKIKTGFNLPRRPLGDFAIRMEGFESSDFGKAHEGRAFVRENDPREGPYSRTGTPYVPHNVVYSGGFPEKHQMQGPSQIPAQSFPTTMQPGSRGFSGFGDIVQTAKDFISAHPLLTIAGLIAGIGLSTGVFKKGFLDNPFSDEGPDEDLFEEN